MLIITLTKRQKAFRGNRRKPFMLWCPGSESNRWHGEFQSPHSLPSQSQTWQKWKNS